MIVCDKCGGKAEYFLSVDYLRNRNMTTLDLCEKHYQDLESWRSESDNAFKVRTEPVGSDGHAKTGKPRTKKD